MTHYKLTADFQDLFGEDPSVLQIIDTRRTAGGGTECRVAPVGVNGPLTAASFLCYRDDLEPIRPR